MARKLGILAAVIFAALGLLHLYWAAGGGWGHAAAIPTSAGGAGGGGRRLFNPSPFGTILVAVALFSAMLVMLGRIGMWGAGLPKWVFIWGTWTLSLVFFLRAIGEFKYVGFFKSVTGTVFAQWDTWLLSPLCLFIALIVATVGYYED